MRISSITDNKQLNFLNQLTKMIEKKLGIDNYLLSEEDIASKYKVDVEEVIKKEKEAILFEMDIKNPKIRRVTILNNFYKSGLNFYSENEGGINSDFTDAIIVKDGKILMGLRNENSTIGSKQWCLLGGGHLEKFLSPERNVKKEIKEETNLEVIDCKLVNIKKINGGKNKIFYFYCTIPKDSEVVINEQEHSNYKWMSLQDILAMKDEEFIFDLRKYLLHDLFNII